MAVEHVNAAGGISVGDKKMPLELILLDDESDATKTVSRLETLAAQGVTSTWRLRLGSPRRRPPRWPKRTGSPTSASPSPSTRSTSRVPLSLLALLEVARHRPPDAGAALADSGRRARQERGHLPGKDDWGAEMAAAWVEAGKASDYQVPVQASTPRGKDFSDLI